MITQAEYDNCLRGSAITVCAGNLSTAGGVLLMAGMHGAAFHDGAAWHTLFNRQGMEP